MKNALYVMGVICLLLVVVTFGPQNDNPAANLSIIAFQFVVMWAFMALYFTGFLVAMKRNHRDCTAIFALNLLTGWTFIGWVISLVWALKVSKEV